MHSLLSTFLVFIHGSEFWSLVIVGPSIESPKKFIAKLAYNAEGIFAFCTF